MGGYRRFLSLYFIFLVLVCSNSALWGKGEDAATPYDISTQRLSQSIRENRRRVPEFEVIRQILKKHKIRGWLMGGSAAAFAHYENWRLRSELGERLIPSERFDYDYYSIYRMTQDLDILIDGDAAEAQTIQAEIDRAIPYTLPHFLSGDKMKSVWEVRCIQDTVNKKISVLDNPEFYWQHSDSDSLELIELTDPPEGEAVVRDLREWTKQDDNRFLWAVTHNTLLYLYSRNHEKTARAKNGKNPAIMEVVRYFGKKFQYGLATRSKDQELLRSVLKKFDPATLKPKPKPAPMRGQPVAAEQGQLKNPGYAEDRIRRLGAKLLINAMNMEQAWNTIVETGLREKLMKVGEPEQPESLAWFFSHSPLLSSTDPAPAGGRTASDLGLSTVVRGIRDYVEYQALTHSYEGEPNVFAEPLKDQGGRRAFATVVDGAPVLGLPVYFKISPEAVEGHDFIVNGNEVFILNKRIIKADSSSLRLGAARFFELLAKGAFPLDNDNNTRLVFLLRRQAFRDLRLHPEALREIVAIVHRQLESPEPNVGLLREWFILPQARDNSEIITTAFEKKNAALDHFLVEEILSRPDWVKPEILRQLLLRGDQGVHVIARRLWDNPYWAEARYELLPEFSALLLEGLDAETKLSENYLSSNGDRLETWLNSVPKGAANNAAALSFIDTCVVALDAKRITWRDFRRLLARTLGKCDPNKEFLERFKERYAKYPLLAKVFSEHRGTFTDSNHADRKDVARTFRKIEAHLECRELLAESAQDEEPKH